MADDSAAIHMNERLVFNYGTSGDSPRETPRLAVAAGPSATGRAPEAAVPNPDRHRDWAFVGLMAFTAVLFFRPQDPIPVLRPLHLAEMTALMALGALVWGRLSRGLPVTRLNYELFGVVALGGIILITAPFSVWMGGAIGTFTDLYLKVLLIFILMVNTLTTTRRIEQFTWIIIVALGYIAFRAVFDYARGVNLIENGRVQGAVGGIFKNPNDLALNLVAVIPLAATAALRGRSAARRVFAATCVLLMLGATVATQSRSGTVGLGVMGLILAIRLVRRRPGLVFGAAVVGVMSLPLLPDSYLQRMSSITNPSLDDTGSREARRTLLREAYAAFLANPLTGVGAGQFKNYDPEHREQAWRETHNVLLQVAAELGVFGLAVFSFLVVRGFAAPFQTRRLLRRVRGGSRRGQAAPVSIPAAELETLDAHQVAMAASMAGWFACALFASVAYHWTFYYMLALAIAPREVLLDRLRVRARSRRRAARPVIALEARA